MNQVTLLIDPTFGCDPEVFLLKKGAVIGAERVIPEEGLGSPNAYGFAYVPGDKKGIVLDGVQVELNPRASNCRALVANEIAAAFITLKKHLEKMDDITVCFNQVVEVDPAELQGLSDKAKILGCAPSLNIYDSNATIAIDPATYNKRSAGGHLHIGLNSNAWLMGARERLPVLHDIFVGNTSVLVDRNTGAAERRKVYGRSGEHRLPEHGFEYRTLSNFWLRAYPLMSGMMGLSRFACNVLAHTVYGEETLNAAADAQAKLNSVYYMDAEKDILSAIDIEKVRKAIDTNDVKLAKENFLIVKDFFAKHSTNWKVGLHAGNLDAFDFFVSKIDSDGLEYWFPDDPMVYWTEKFHHSTSHTGIQRGVQGGWEHFLEKVVGPEMKNGIHV